MAPIRISDLSADASKASNIAGIAAMGVGVGSSVFSVISNIQDSKQRALFDANFRALSADQQKKIDQQVAAASSQSEKLRILANTLTQLSISRITTQAGLITEEERNKRNQMIVIGALMITTGLIITYIIIKKL
jgi:hypothetical protein